jgi:hypothetical protein
MTRTLRLIPSKHHDSDGSNRDQSSFVSPSLGSRVSSTVALWIPALGAAADGVEDAFGDFDLDLGVEDEDEDLDDFFFVGTSQPQRGVQESICVEDARQM